MRVDSPDTVDCPVVVDLDGLPNELVVLSRQGRIHEHGSTCRRGPIRLVDVTEDMQRRPNTADRTQQLFTSLIPIAATANIKDPQGGTVGNHEIRPYWDS